MWKIEKIVCKGDYLYGVVKQHPRASERGYVLLHRLVMENFLERLLNYDEVVHHKNGNKKDNSISNLEVMSVIEHARHHSLTQGRAYVDLICPSCGEFFTKERRQTHLVKRGKYTTCSPKCRGKFSREIQLRGLTAEVESAISGNIVLEYKLYSSDNPEET